MRDEITRELGLRELERLAAALGPRLARGDVLALYGELGAGKTTFVRALLRGMGWAGEVPSPTFTLVQVYDVRPVAVWHFDLFRLTVPEEVLELGLEDALAEGATLIEWPERLGDRLPRPSLAVRLVFTDKPSTRRVTIGGPPPDQWGRFGDILLPA